MSNNIDSLTNQYLQVTGKTASTNAPGAPGADDAAADKARNAAQSDTIELTDTALRMQALEQRLQQLGEVDQSRVEEVRSRIESGNYEISAERVAQKMIAMDRSLPEDK